ncbi:MAG: STY4851/ECs_5259 family protein [Methylococcaceae bacterium]
MPTKHIPKKIRQAMVDVNLQNITPEKWLNAFLKERGLSTPNSQILFKYQMTDAEYLILKKTLEFISVLSEDVTRLTKLTKWNEVFVIYGAEWWRREYNGGPWRWSTLFSSFDADPTALSNQQRNEIIIKGLRFWGLKVRMINGKFRYLGTLSIEGGLPLNQLNNNSAWLSRVFRHAILKYTRLHHTGIKTDAIIRECEYIPKTYQNDQICIILGDIIKTVVKLKQDYQLDNQEDPIAYLDKQLPNWRKNFPLPIDSDVSKKLMGVFFEPSSNEKNNLPFRGLRTLDDNDQLLLKLEFAGFIRLDDLNLQETIPSRLNVELFSNEGDIYLLGVAVKSIYQGNPSLKMPSSNVSFKSELASQGYAIRFKHLTTSIYESPIIGCEELDNDVPWVFVKKNDEWILEGVASVSTRSTEVKILCPVEFNYPATTEITNISVINNKKLIQSSGIVKLTDNENNFFLIKTAQVQSAKLYYLIGNTLSFVSTPNKVYLGLPTLICFDIEMGTRTEIKANRLVCRAVNSRENWQTLTTNHHGIYEIRLRDNEGNIQFRNKCVLLPEQFSIRFKAAVDSLDGSIFLENIGTAKVSCQLSVKHNISTIGNVVQLDLFAENSPPDNIQLTLYWSNMTQMLILTMPFPARGGQLINGNGHRVLTRAVFADQLYGYRLRLFNEQPQFRRHLQVEISLRDDTLEFQARQDLYFRNIIEVQGAVIELALIDYQIWIKSLLAISRNLDSYATLVVYEKGTELLRVNIYRYQFVLESNWAEGSVVLSASDQAQLSYDNITNIDLMAMRLAQPVQEHIKLDMQKSEQTTIGSWLFYPEKREDGPWMIYPSANSSVSLRPMLWRVGLTPDVSDTVNNHIKTLHEAVNLPGKDSRNKIIADILTDMCADFEHSGWEYLRQLSKQNEHLPLTTFNIWSVAVTNTQFLPALVLQMDESFSQRFGEELPVFWELIPLADWVSVFSAYKDYLKKVIDDEPDVLILLNGRIKRISHLCVSMEIVTDILRVSLLGDSDQQLNFMKSAPDIARQITIEAINAAKQELLARHANSNWPEVLKSELIFHATRIESIQQQWLNINNMMDYQRALIILPVLLAVCCSKGDIPNSWVGDAVIIFKLKCLKDFDCDWFNATFKITLAYLSQQATY